MPEQTQPAPAPQDDPLVARADRLLVRDHVVEADIGAFQEEQGRRQRLSFTLVVDVDPAAGAPDDVDGILSYDILTRAVAEELGLGRVDLLETLAERIARRVLAAPQARRVLVRVEKLERGPGALGVEILRSRGDVDAIQPAPPPAPVVVHLAGATGFGPHLGRWLDRLQAGPDPVILTVDAPGLPLPEAERPVPRRRIALLAIEQNAWALASRDARCAVVSSRTELDWALRHRRLVVWAPAKVVRDSRHAPQSDDALTLALWLAADLGARRLLLVGGAAPADPPVPVVVLPDAAGAFDLGTSP